MSEFDAVLHQKAKPSYFPRKKVERALAMAYTTLIELSKTTPLPVSHQEKLGNDMDEMRRRATTKRPHPQH
jgi:hypothetical protein